MNDSSTVQPPVESLSRRGVVSSILYFDSCYSSYVVHVNSGLKLSLCSDKSIVISNMLSTEEYRAKRVVGKEVRDGKVFYLIKWGNSWEPAENCIAAQTLIDEYEASQVSGKRQRSKSINGKQRIHKLVSSTGININEMSEQCGRLRISNVPRSIGSIDTFKDEEDYKKKKELLEKTDSEIEILGAFPTDEGSLTLGLRIKGRTEDSDICHFDKEEVKMLFPNLYMSFLESRIIFR